MTRFPEGAEYRVVLSSVKAESREQAAAELVLLFPIDEVSARQVLSAAPIVLIEKLTAEQAKNVDSHLACLRRLGVGIEVTADMVANAKHMRLPVKPSIALLPGNMFMCPSCGERFVVERYDPAARAAGASAAPRMAEPVAEVPAVQAASASTPAGIAENVELREISPKTETASGAAGQVPQPPAQPASKPEAPVLGQWSLKHDEERSPKAPALKPASQPRVSPRPAASSQLRPAASPAGLQSKEAGPAVRPMPKPQPPQSAAPNPAAGASQLRPAAPKPAQPAAPTGAAPASAQPKPAAPAPAAPGPATLKPAQPAASAGAAPASAQPKPAAPAPAAPGPAMLKPAQPAASGATAPAPAQPKPADSKPIGEPEIRILDESGAAVKPAPAGSADAGTCRVAIIKKLKPKQKRPVAELIAKYQGVSIEEATKATSKAVIAVMRNGSKEQAESCVNELKALGVAAQVKER